MLGVAKTIRLSIFGVVLVVSPLCHASEVVKPSNKVVMDRSYLTAPKNQAAWNDGTPGSGQIAAGVVAVDYDPFTVYPVLLREKAPVAIILPAWEHIGSVNLEDSISFQYAFDKTKANIVYVWPGPLLGKDTAFHVQGSIPTGREHSHTNTYSFLLSSVPRDSLQKTDIQYVLYDQAPSAVSVDYRSTSALPKPFLDAAIDLPAVEKKSASVKSYDDLTEAKADQKGLEVTPSISLSVEGPVEALDEPVQRLQAPDAKKADVFAAAKRADNRKNTQTQINDDVDLLLNEGAAGAKKPLTLQAEKPRHLADHFVSGAYVSDEAGVIDLLEEQKTTWVTAKDLKTTIFEWAEKAGVHAPLWKTATNYTIDVQTEFRGSFREVTTELLTPYTVAPDPIVPVIDNVGTVCVFSPNGRASDLSLSVIKSQAEEACGAKIEQVGR